MSSIEPAATAATAGPRHGATIAALALTLAAACLAGCAQAPAAQANTASRSETALAGGTKPPAKPATCAKPEYPKAARRRGSEGTTTLRFLIDTDGSVARSEVAQSSGDSALDESARAAVSQCKFKPAVIDGKATRAWVAVQYVWSLAPASASRTPAPPAAQP